MNNLTHWGTIEIATERLYLKRIEKYDATSMYSNFASDDRVSQYMSWDIFKTVEDVEKCIDEYQEEYKKDDTYYWDNGYTWEAIKSIIDFAFTNVWYNRVEAYHAKSNTQSARVMQKAGMKLDGTLRQRCKTFNGFEDCIYYSIIREQAINVIKTGPNFRTGFIFVLTFLLFRVITHSTGGW